MAPLVDYRDKELCQKLLDGILAVHRKPVRLMEVCGTHTMSISRFGIRQMLPDTITLLSGPGCPVCVTSQKEIDLFISLANYPETIVTTFGDLLRVPGSNSSLQKERANGADVRIVYSTLDALEIAKSNPDKEVVFLGVGFETTAPTIAAAIIAAKNQSIKNFSVISAHKLVPPALVALMDNEQVKIDGFICPGHVSVIIGAGAYQPIAEKYHVPCVITGFEPLDIFQGLYKLIEQLEKGTAEVENAYKRTVTWDGNKKARQILDEVFEPVDSEWRGLGVIPGSGLKIRSRYREFDASEKFAPTVSDAQDPPGCSCGEILAGIKNPFQCPLFGKLCVPENPVGPCMVSSEGTCAAYYRYESLNK